jgi:small glutamine-rich tetratricopeptide repeat-containing protein alpha
MASTSSPQASSTTPKQRLALSIVDFLNKSLADGTVTGDEKDGIEIATNCIAEAFKVDPATQTLPANTQPLFGIYAAYEALKAASGAAVQKPIKEPTAEEKKEAEGLKSKGNAAMAGKDYPAAIKLYTEALALHPGNAVFLSNRAAAYSAAKDHDAAQADAEAAVAIDPKYTKAWSRLGLARYALGDPKGSMEAYQKGIDHEGNGGSEAMKKGYETAKRRVEEVEGEGSARSVSGSGAGAGASAGAGAGGGMPDFSSLASMLGGAGRGRGEDGASAGGLDLGSIMSNPMFQNMAQSLMNNPDMMNNLMSNPRLRDMASQLSGGGGMPDLGSMMNDPSIAEM